MRRKLSRVEASLLAPVLQDQIDRLGRQRSAVYISPLVDATEHRAFVYAGLIKPLLQRGNGPADQQHMLVVVTLCRLGAAKADREAGEGRGGELAADGFV